MKKTTVIAGTLALLGAITAGCGSSAHLSTTSSSSAASSASSSTASSASTTASTSASASPTAAAADKTRLAAMVLQPADLPTGWTATPHTDDPGDAATQAALVACVGGQNTDADKVADVSSPDFSLNDASISSEASSYKTPADLNADLALITSPKISDCYASLLKTELGATLPAGSTLGTVTITITPGSGGGPSNVVATGTGVITVTAQGQQIPIYIAVAFMTGPLIEAEVDFENPTQAVPTAMFAGLVANVAGRVSKG